jgi:hypothetical protein
VFGQGQAADALRPGPVLAALTEQAVADLAVLSDDQLTGALHAARRLENRAAYLQTLSVAEFGRRRAAQYEDAKARRVPPARRPGEFAADELASELVVTANHADARLERDAALTARLPKTLAGLGAGIISGDRADLVAAWTASLSDAAAALEMKLNPEGVKVRKEHAKATRQRVEVRREDTGNASLAGRELDTVTAIACKAYIDALAVRIRNCGHVEGPLSMIGARVMTELLQGRNPLDLITPRPRPRLAGPGAPGQDADGPAGHEPGSDRAASAGDGREPLAEGREPRARDGAEARAPDDTQTKRTEAPGGADARDPDDPGPDYPTTRRLRRLRRPGRPRRSRRPGPQLRRPARRRGPLRPGQSAPLPANLNLTIPSAPSLAGSPPPPKPAPSASWTPKRPAP